MRISRRPLVILTAYSCAVLAAVVPILAIGLMVSTTIRAPSTEELLYAVSLFACVAAIYALPVAIPVVAYTEIKGVGAIQIFLGSGLLLAILLSAVLGGGSFTFTTTLLSSTLAGAILYWLIAWKILPPARKPQPLAEA